MKKRWLAFAMSISMAFTLMYGNAVAAEDHVERMNVVATGGDSAEAQNPGIGNLRIATSGNAIENKATGSNGIKQESIQLANLATLSDAVKNAPVYSVGSTEELSNALATISADQDNEEAVIELTTNVDVPHLVNNQYVNEFGVSGKHITVCSAGENIYAFTFSNQAVLTGDCTFDNVDVKAYKLYCNGYRTIFTENGQIHLTGTLYGGGYKTSVASTYVVIAATGEINPTATNGLHNVIGGSYQANVEGDTYLEITGDIKFKGGNHITPGCVMGDGTSGDANNSPDVSVGGTATLIYDNKNAQTSPSIVGTTGCEMKGDVILDVRSGKTNEICGNYEYPEKSIIRGNLHIIAGTEEYENTDRTLRLGGNWPISGGGNRFAISPFNTKMYTIDGNITIDTFENVWGWDKGETIPSDVPEIYGALYCKVGGDITINAHGSHMENITGANSSTVRGSVTVNAVNVELKNCYYETRYDEGNIYGLYEDKDVSNAGGTVTINVADGDIALILATDQNEVNEGSSINVSGSPKVRTGVLGTAARGLNDENGKNYQFPTVNLQSCQATIPFVQAAAQVNVKDNSDVTLHEAELDKGLLVEKESKLTTDDNQIHIWGNVEVNGVWEQKHTQDDDDNDIYVQGTTTVGEGGCFINHGTSNLKGDVTNNGTMVLMNSAFMQGNYMGEHAELRIPVVATNYDGTDAGGDIPLLIQGKSSGSTIVNTVKADDWQMLQSPNFGENYILSAKDGDAPEQKTFLLGNEDALLQGLFLKRINDADTTDDTYYMWQVANGINVIFDKNGGDTEADPRIAFQDKVAGTINHFDLPTTDPTRANYELTGWNTKPDGTGDPFTAQTDVTKSMKVYAQWKANEAYSVEISPMNITVYVGGEGYRGVIGEDGEFASNDLPEIGFYLTLPDDVNAMLGSTDEKPVDLSNILRLTYDDENGTTRSWSLEQYGDETMSRVMENGHRVYIYKLKASQIDGTDETVPARVQFTRADGSVMEDSEFKALVNDQFRNYKISFYPGQLDEAIYKATFTTTDGRTLTRPIRLGTGSLKVRGNNDETYRVISDTTPTVDSDDSDIMLAATAQNDTKYYIGDSGVNVDADGVRLLVDHSLDDALLTAYINQNKNADGKYAYQFRYLDLVDTSNGNAYVTMGADQKIDLYWPVPNDAKADSEFHIIHFKGLDRESNADINDLLTTRIPEEVECEPTIIDGKKFIKFTVNSFSPFALLYEKGSGSSVNPGTPDKPGQPGTTDPAKPVTSSNADKQTPSNANRSDSSDDSDDSGSSTNSKKSKTVTTNETKTTTETTENSNAMEETRTDTFTETLPDGSPADEPSIDATPKTGDESSTRMYLMLMELSLLAIIGLTILKRKQEKDPKTEQ